MDVAIVVFVLIAILVVLLPIKGGFKTKLSPAGVWLLILIGLAAIYYFINYH